MEQINQTTVLVALAPAMVAFFTLIFTIYQWKKTLREDRKQREIAMKRDDELREAAIKREDEARENEKREQEKEKRIDFLVNTIKDNEMPLAMRQAAAVEYIDTGYNGVTRAYIIQNHLYVKNPLPEFK
jgi:hypothetical protein